MPASEVNYEVGCAYGFEAAIVTRVMDTICLSWVLHGTFGFDHSRSQANQSTILILCCSGKIRYSDEESQGAQPVKTQENLKGD